MNGLRLLSRIARYAWASPCTLLGLLAAGLLVVAGGNARVRFGILEVLAAAPRAEGRRPRFDAITLGHVVLARDERALTALRAHELEHVRQYERWGLVFIPAYAFSSLIQLLKGRDPYWLNGFEVRARKRSNDDEPRPVA